LNLLLLFIKQLNEMNFKYTYYINTKKAKYCNSKKHFFPMSLLLDY